MQRTKKLSIEYVNRVKLEMVKDFQDSIFSDVYSNAHMQIECMIAVADAQGLSHDAEEFCAGNEISNVISFVGERGMGKSSAMLSFAYFLKNYPQNIEGKKSKSFYFKKNEKIIKNLSFHTLSKVDATILTNESLFDVVLAKMWTKFSDKTEQLGEDKFGLSSTKERFNSIKNVYTLYYKDEKQNKNLTSVKQLQELSRSMALREEFARLVSSYLGCMVADDRIAQCDRYLVIPIDDLDLASGKTFAILEDLRIFLSVPQVIVLTTVDIERLLLCGNKNFSNELICSDIAEEDEKNLVRQYSNQYIAKVLPRNSRISMPRYGRDGDIKFVLDYGKYVSDLMKVSEESDKREDVDYLSFVNMVIAKHLNLIMKHRDGLTLPVESLRNIVNRASELWTIHCYYGDNAKNFLFEWLEKEILLSFEQFHGMKNFSRIKNFSSVSVDDYNAYIVHNLAKKKTARAARAGYGQVLCCLLDVWNKSYGESDLLKELVLYYSLQIAKCVDEKDVGTLATSFVRRDIFSSVISKKVIFRFETVRRVERFLQLELKYDAETDTASDIMRKNAQQIADLFKVFLFCNMENVMKSVELEIEEDFDRPKEIPGAEIQSGMIMHRIAPGEAILGMRGRIAISLISVDNLFWNALKYGELFNKYIHWIYKPLKKYMLQKGKRADEIKFDVLYDEILAIAKSGVKEMQEWKEEYGIEEIYDILPIQNVGVMMGIINRIMQSGILWATIDQMMAELKKAFLNEFEEAENECLYGELGYQRYSRKFKDLLRYINLKDVPSTMKKRLAIMAQHIEDTAKLE